MPKGKKGFQSSMHPWNYKKHLSKATKKKISDAIIERYRTGQQVSKKGIPLSQKTKDKISRANTGKQAWNKGKHGFKAWNKGLTKERYKDYGKTNTKGNKETGLIGRIKDIFGIM